MRIRRVILVGGGSLFLIAALIVCAWVWAGRTGTTPIEGWIGEYFVRVAQSHLNPSLRWERLDYQAPLTVVIDRPRLEHEGMPIVAMKRLTIELASVPRQGAPVVIENARLEGPVFTFHAKPDGGCQGWDDLLRPDAERASVSQGYRVSDVFRMRKLIIHDAGVEFRPSGGEPPLSWSGISANLGAAPDDDDSGWYRVAAEVKREDVLAVSLRGRFNIDRFELECDPFHLAGTLLRAESSSFPLPIGRWLDEREARGRLDLVARGTLTPKDWRSTTLAVELELRDASVLLQAERLSIDRLSARGDVSKGVIESRFDADILGGRVTGSFAGDSTDASARLAAQIEGIELAGLNQLLQSTRVQLPLRCTGGRVDAGATVLLRGPDITRSSVEFRAKARNVEALIEAPTLGPATRRSGAWEPNLRLSELDASGRIDAGHVTLNFTAPLPPGTATVGVTHDRAAGLTEIDIRAERVDGRALVPFVPVTWPASVRASSIGGVLTGQARIRRASTGDAGFELTVAARADDARARVAERDLQFIVDDLQIDLREGRFELRSAARIEEGRLTVSLNGASDDGDALDVQVQFTDLDSKLLLELARTHLPSGLDLRGRASGALSGRFARSEWLAGRGRTTIRLAPCELLFSGGQVAFPQADLVAELRDRGLTFDCRIAACSGVIAGGGRAGLNADGGVEVSWEASGIDLAQAMRAMGIRESGLVGILNMTGNLAFARLNPTQTLTGSAAGRVENAVLVDIPIVSGILSLMRANAANLLSAGGMNDRLVFRCAIRPGYVDFQQFDFETATVTARSTGRVGFDRAIDMQVRAAPLGRVTTLLGPAGRLIDEASGGLMSFSVSGSVSQPAIMPRPLGLRVP